MPARPLNRRLMKNAPPVLTPMRILVDPAGGLPAPVVDALSDLYSARTQIVPDPATADIVVLLPGASLSASRIGSRPVVLDATSAAASPVPLGSLREAITLEDDPAVPRSFRNRRVFDELGGAAPLQPGRGERPLARGSQGPLWVSSADDRIHRVALSPATNSPRLVDEFGPGRFMRMLPLLAIVRAAACGDRGEPRALPATIVVDDPNLRMCRYGYLDYRAIHRAAVDAPLHVALATIPLDSWYASPRAAAYFRTETAALSLLVHGNNHLSEELGRRYSVGEADGLLLQALARIGRLERRTGVRVSRVMAAPHGACSHEMARALARCGLAALTISRARPWGEEPADRTDAALGARSVELVDGLPLLRRIHVDRLQEVPFAAFLHQPLVPYGHHWDWPDGVEDLVRLATETASAGPVVWGGLEQAASLPPQLVREGSRMVVRLRSRAASFAIPDWAESLTFDPRGMHGNDAVLLDGREAPPELEHPVTPGADVQIALSARDAPSGRRRLPRTPPRAIARRLLTESRDRLQPVLRRGRPR